MICDFCSSPDVQWFYPARDFVVNFDLNTKRFKQGSAGYWAACPACHALIERGQRDKLARRSAKRFAIKYGVKPPQLEQHLRALHDQFWANREGAPRPIT